MKNIILFLIVVFTIQNVFAQKQRYFDENNKEISKRKYQRKKSESKYVEIQRDTSNIRKVVLRIKEGKLENKQQVFNLLEKEIGASFNYSKPIVIIYYSAKDFCSYIGSSSLYLSEEWYQNFEGGLMKNAQVKPYYFYKEVIGLEEKNKFIKWNNDPEDILEKTFFLENKKCAGFVIIAKTGDYISYFDEYLPEDVWRFAKKIKRRYLD